MALSGRLETTVELKSPADKFYAVFKETPYDVATHAPHIHSIDLHDTDWDAYGHGSIKTWTYTSEGNVEVYKERAEYDDANLTVHFVGVDGHPMKLYKTFDPAIKVEPKGESGSLATISIDYEKVSPETRDPGMYVDVMVGFVKATDAALSKD